MLIQSGHGNFWFCFRASPRHAEQALQGVPLFFFFFFITLGLVLSDAKVYEP
jgi:hypothetical protein